MSEGRSIKIAVTALGGQGGGVVADWIVKLGERCGYIAQSTSVPGVAQRTGATVYYVELFPESAARKKGKSPVLALMPVPGDVDIVVAAELMEAGRAIMRGFVTKKTTLIASSHRDFAISEKIAMGDGRQGVSSVIQAAENSAGRLVLANMADAASSAGAVISAVLFGALAGSGALPIERAQFEETIRQSGRAVENNLRGFARGFETAAASYPSDTKKTNATNREAQAQPGNKVAFLAERLSRDFPPATHYILREGLMRVIDFQDGKYGSLYLDRLTKILSADRAGGGEAKGWRLTEKVGKHLALWMTYEDSIRVADLKTRASRFTRFREDVHAQENQIVEVSEYFHPRVEEICDILPAGIGRSILNNSGMRKGMGVLLGNGRRISTSKLRGFMPLYLMASLRPLRRASYRFKVEQQRIEHWLSLIRREASSSYAAASAVAELQGLIKGYGDTHERGLRSYNAIIDVFESIKMRPDVANLLVVLRDAALHDEDGVGLSSAIKRIGEDQAAA